MARFHGEVGYAVSALETPPGSGNWVDQPMTEVLYFGDLVRNSRQLREADKINDDISVSNSISIVGDAYAFGNFFAMRYIRWMGSLWVVNDVTVQAPRLLLALGGIYNGPTAPEATGSSADDNA